MLRQISYFLAFITFTTTYVSAGIFSGRSDLFKEMKAASLLSLKGQDGEALIIFEKVYGLSGVTRALQEISIKKVDDPISLMIGMCFDPEKPILIEVVTKILLINILDNRYQTLLLGLRLNYLEMLSNLEKRDSLQSTSESLHSKIEKLHFLLAALNKILERNVVGYDRQINYMAPELLKDIREESRDHFTRITINAQMQRDLDDLKAAISKRFSFSLPDSVKVKLFGCKYVLRRSKTNEQD